MRSTRLLGALAVLDQVGHRHELQAVAAAELHEVGHAGHRPVVLHDLADDAGRGEAREPREVDGGLRLPRALEHAAGAGAEREDVTGMDEVVRRRGRVDGDLDRPRAVSGRDARRDAVAGLDRDRERGAELRLVLVGHLAQPELVAALGGQAEADEPATVDRHEVDGVGRHELRRDGEVALVLAVVVVDDDDEATRTDLLDRVLDPGERAGDGLGHGGHRVIVPWSDEALHVLREHVDLEVDRLAGSEVAQRRRLASVCGTRATARRRRELGDGERDAVDCDRALLDAVAEDLGGRLDDDPQALALGLHRPDGADPVDVALYVVAAERVAGAQRRLDVHVVAGGEARPAWSGAASPRRRGTRCAPSSASAVT